MKKIPGPDFPTAGFIYGTAGIKDAYESGRGLLTLRAKVRSEEHTSELQSQPCISYSMAICPNRSSGGI